MCGIRGAETHRNIRLGPIRMWDLRSWDPQWCGIRGAGIHSGVGSAELAAAPEGNGSLGIVASTYRSLRAPLFRGEHASDRAALRAPCEAVGIGVEMGPSEDAACHTAASPRRDITKLPRNGQSMQWLLAALRMIGMCVCPRRKARWLMRESHMSIRIPLPDPRTRPCIPYEHPDPSSRSPNATLHPIRGSGSLF